jgi:predicted nucleic acid-binding protein
MQGAPRHSIARRHLDRQVASGAKLGLTPQVLFELGHICTDPRRFERPMTVEQAALFVRELWDRREVVRLVPGPSVVHHTAALLATLRLGRKRILDTVLAATLENAEITRLATFNGSDFAVFPFLEIVAG